MKHIKKNQWPIKLLLFSISLIVSIISVEIILHLLVNKTNLPRVYHDVAEYNLYDSEEAGKTDYKRDHSFEIYDSKSNLEVLCLGDSFTNGGNTFGDNSYPYKLFLKFEKKITVRNLGVCASTTEQIANRIQDFFSSDQYSPKKRYVIAIMAGSADVFANKNLVQTIQGLNISQDQKWVGMKNNDLPSLGPNALSNFYFYRILYLLGNEIENIFFKTQSSFLGPIAFSTNGLETCRAKNDGKDRANCLAGMLKSDSYKNVSQGMKEHLIIRFLLEEKTFKSSEVTSILQDFMIIAKHEPRLLERDYLIMNLLGLVKLQDVVTYQELSDFIESNSSSLSEKTKSINAELRKNSEYWYNNLRGLNSQRNIYWNKIFQIAKNYNSEVIIMNYPLPYKSTNGYLANMSSEKGAEFIDLEKIFLSSRSGETELLDDWEHCSPEGYSLIADKLYDKIKK